MRGGIYINNVQSSPKIVTEIMSRISSLNQSYQKVAYYIVSNFDKMVGVTISTLAQNCGVSEPTVTRFVKEIGYKNYRDFQQEIIKSSASEPKKKSNSGYRDVSVNDNMRTLCEKIFANNVQALMDTLTRIDMEKMKAASDYLNKAERVFIFAQGRSQTVAYSFQHRLLRLGVTCMISSDTHVIATTSSLVREDDVVIGISNFGRTRSVVEGMERAQKLGAKVIGITGHTGVPLEKYADVVLCAMDNRSEPFEYETSCAAVTQMVVLDCLYMDLLLKLGDKAEDRLHSTYEALKNERL